MTQRRYKTPQDPTTVVLLYFDPQQRLTDELKLRLYNTYIIMRDCSIYFSIS